MIDSNGQADIEILAGKPDPRGRRLFRLLSNGVEIHRDLFDGNEDYRREQFVKAGFVNVPLAQQFKWQTDLDDPTSPLRDMLMVAVRTSEARESGEDRDKFAISRLTSQEFDSGDYARSYLVDGVLCEGESLVIAAALKSMKTTLAVALAVALALGRAFLGKFAVREAVNVLLLSGESGLSTLQNTGRRIAESYGYSLGDVGRLFWSTDLPRLGHIEHIEALREALTRDEIQVLICDPLYFMLPGQDAGNLMVVGGYLRTLSDLCQELGVTLIVVHHVKKSGIDDKHAPPELSQISWSGTAEWARQWILLSRITPYKAGTGEHLLWMVTGGSAGHSGLHALHICEGVGHDRYWQVDVLDPDEMQDRDQDAKEQAKHDKQAKQLDRDKRAILSAVAKMPDQQGTKTDIKDRTGLNTKAFNAALAALLTDGEIFDCEITKSNKQTYPGFRLAKEGEKPA